MLCVDQAQRSQAWIAGDGVTGDGATGDVATGYKDDDDGDGRQLGEEKTRERGDLGG